MDKDLIVPIYIDTNTLLDLLATIEDGFSLVEKVTSRKLEGKTAEQSAQGEGGTEFGIPNVLNLLKIKLGGSYATKSSTENVAETQTERYHTYGSLLARLRSHLRKNSLVLQIDGDIGQWWADIQPSTFVEVRGVFRPNPLADTLKATERVAAISMAVGKLADQPTLSSTVNQRKKTQKGQQNPMDQMRKMSQEMLADIELEKLRLFVVDLKADPFCRAVVLLALDYLRDPSLAEIAHKEFKLLGKVVRKLDLDSDETIKLLRGTGLGSFGKEILGPFIEAFDSMEGLEFPKPEIEIAGPALEILPIAIFV